MKYIQLLFALLLYLIPFVLTQTQLLFVFKAFRHGARGPHDKVTDNRDLFDYKWDTLGELTQVGMRMHYALGYETGLRYKPFISAQNFDPSEILIMSTNLNRTVQSALSFIQGLYPSPKGHSLSTTQLTKAKPPNDVSSLQSDIEALGNKALPNQITIAPLHIFHKTDYMYISQEIDHVSFKCDALSNQWNQNGKSQEVIDVVNQFNTDYGIKLNSIIPTLEGKPIDAIVMIAICDHFFADDAEGKGIDVKLEGAGITYSAFRSSCEKISQMYLSTIINDDPKGNILKLTVSKPLESILEKMQMRIDLDKNGFPTKIDTKAPKFLIHSAHDSSLMGLMMTLKNFFPGAIIKNPYYASNLRLELHKDTVTETGKYIVKYYIEDGKPYSLQFDELKTKVENWKWTTKQIEDYCGWKTDVPEDIVPENPNLTGLYVGLGILIILFLALAIVFFIMRRMWVEKGKPLGNLLKIKNML